MGITVSTICREPFFFLYFLFFAKDEKCKSKKRRSGIALTWQMLDVGGQQLGSLLLKALLRDVT